MLARARERLGAQGRRTILFLDEIHRFNKAQQDALLPAVEEGLVTLIGATTENPYFEVNSAPCSAAFSSTSSTPLELSELERVIDAGRGGAGDRAAARRCGRWSPAAPAVTPATR